VDVTYDTFKFEKKTEKGAAVKVKTGYKICRWAQLPDNKLGVMPSILEELLHARKTTRKKGKMSKDPFMQNVLDKRQLSIKVCANSLYGQCGAKTSTFYEKDVAASTTATGRLLLTYGKRVVEECYGDRLCPVDIPETKHKMVRTRAEVIYGDTDSLFIHLHMETEAGELIKGFEALALSMVLTKEIGLVATMHLKAPHDLEYEKSLMPYCLLSKKRYVGMLYENDPLVGYRKSMGIVLSRRDNAPVVKDVYGGVIDILMKEKDVGKALEFLNNELDALVAGKVDDRKLVVTKSLRGYYKNPNQIAHKVLTNRIALRNPGNEPKAGDRIGYMYFVNHEAKLQGDKIDTPEYIREMKLPIDYGHYLSNQLLKPISQLFALILPDIPAFKSQEIRFNRTLASHKRTMTPEKFETRETKMRMDMVKTLLFGNQLRICLNKKNNNASITSFFGGG
jgi:DNA polymerase elongation subunit (family B)